MQTTRPGREFDRSEAPLYLLLTKKTNRCVAIFRVEVGETVFSSGENIHPGNAGTDGTGSLDREIQAKDPARDH